MSLIHLRFLLCLEGSNIDIALASARYRGLSAKKYGRADSKPVI